MERLIGDSPVMGQLRRRLEIAAPTPLPVLITGETGTGKEEVARALHALSGRRGPFIAVDCGALSQSLVETELFGHERGAFTGATQRRDGLVAAARGGTFFLDEVGELPVDTQTRLLRLLENGTYRPVGATEQRAADLRIVAATWRDLPTRVHEGRFRADLLHRLTLVELALPPLRERVTDILPLFQHFLDQARGPDRPPFVVEPSTRRHLERWPWPGNVRELRNAAAYVAALGSSPRIRIEDLPPQLHRLPAQPPDAPPSAGWMPADVRVDLAYMDARRLFLDDFQQRYVEAQLRAHGGNVSAAARASGMDRRSIQRIIARARGEGEGGP